MNERATAVEIGGLVDGVGVPVMRAGYALKAKPSWITLSAVEGAGNSQVDVTAPVYKGRNGRSGLITVAVEDLTEDVTLQQEGSTIWDVTTQSLAFVKTGEAKKFIGNSNLASITFTVDSSASSWLTAGKLVVNEKEYNSGAEIAGDPGADNVYAFEITFTAAANPTVDTRTGYIIVNGQKYSVTQAAGDATLTVSPTALTFASTGETKQITITTNTAWTIS
ncbi:MAG: BACON domain-containing carbohydrate-binding protein [Clostridia bacterium]